MLAVICIIIAVLGLILILLSVLPYTSAYAPHGLPAGIALVVVGVILYIVLALFAHSAPTYDNPMRGDYGQGRTDHGTATAWGYHAVDHTAPRYSTAAGRWPA